MAYPLVRLRTQVLRAVRIGSIIGTGLAGCAEDAEGLDPGACTRGTGATACYSRAQLEDMVRFGTGMVPQPQASEEEVRAAFEGQFCLPSSRVSDSCCNSAVDGPVQEGQECCYIHCTGACCGRPLVIDGLARLAATVVRSDWMLKPGRLDAVPHDAESVPHALRAGIASEWMQAARMEHASVASFARFTLDLLANGAPADLVADAQRAGLDEVEHARACFEIASWYAGAPQGPGALDIAGAVPSASLCDAVLAAVVEGCIGETVAAACAEHQARMSTDPRIASILAGIARDEARHAELAYRFVAWGIARDASLAAPVARAFRGAFVCSASAPATQDLPPDMLAVWHAAGCLGTNDRAQITAQALSEVIAPAVEALVRLPRCDASATHPSA